MEKDLFFFKQKLYSGTKKIKICINYISIIFKCLDWKSSHSTYTYTKGGIASTRSLAVELGKYNIRVNSVYYGSIKTDAYKAIKRV